MGAPAAAAMFGVKVAGAANSDTRPLDIQVLSAPTSGYIKAVRASGNATPTITTVTQVTNAPTTTNSATLTFAGPPVFSVGDVIFDTTSGSLVPIGTVSAVGINSVTLAANATSMVANTDTLRAAHSVKVSQAANAGTATNSSVLSFAATPVFSVGDIVYDSAAATPSLALGVVASVGANTVTLASNSSQTVANNDNITATHGLVSVPATTSNATNIPSYAVGDNVYLSASVPGTYTLKLFKDTNLDSAYESNTDDATPTFTLTVKSPADAFTLAAPTTVGAGTKGAMATVSSSATTTDVRGGSPSTYSSALASLLSFGITDNGVISAATSAGTLTNSAVLNFSPSTLPAWTVGDAVFNSSNQLLGTILSISTLNSTVTLNANTNVPVSTGDTLHANGHGVLGEGNGGPATFDSTNGIYTYLGSSSTQALTQGVATPHTLTTSLSFAGVPTTLSTKTTEITTNGVAHLALAVGTGQASNVLISGANASVRTGTSTVSYSATATDNSSPNNLTLAGRTVTFTITPGSGTAYADLSVGGTPIPATGATQGQVTATTDSNGVATIAVTSAQTATGNAYTVAAASGAAPAPPTINTSYAAAAVSSITITSTSAALTPTVGTASVPVTGQLNDQFGQSFQPPSSASQQVTVSGAATGNAVVTNGSFTYTYTPATAPAAGTTTALTFTYAPTGSSATATIQWASTTAAATITLTAPVTGATAVTLQDNTTPVPAQVNGGTPAFGNTTGAVTGTVYDSTNTALAFKTVTLTGDPGVYFSTSATPDATHQLVTSLDVVTTNTGSLTGAYVYYTKAGTAKITATAGTAVATSTVTTSAPVAGQAYAVTVDDTAGTPGSTLILTGEVTDIFGNPVPSARVDLSTGASTIGALGSTLVTTNSAGIWSTSFITGSNQSGDVTVTATLDGQTANATPIAAYATAGLTGLTAGDYQSSAQVTVSDVPLDITSSAGSVTSGSSGAHVTITGTFLPNSSVQILVKESGASAYSVLDVLKADSTGAYTHTYTIKKTSTFLATSESMSSSPQTVTVKSAFSSVTAKALSGGRVRLYANGNPNGKYKMSFYRSKAGKDPRVAYKTTNGFGSVTVTVSAPKGTDKYYATYTASGTSKGTSKTVSVKVK